MPNFNSFDNFASQGSYQKTVKEKKYYNFDEFEDKTSKKKIQKKKDSQIARQRKMKRQED